MKNNLPVRLAIADDHKLLCDGLSAIITSYAGFAVNMIAHNGYELICQLTKAVTLPDICLLDISMPEKNGYDTISEVKKRWPSIKVLILSISPNEDSILRMLRLGASGYLLKNSPATELMEALQTIHRTGYYHSDLTKAHMSQAFNSRRKQMQNINDKEIVFLTHCCSEDCYKEIAVKMKVSQRTVEGYRDALFQKLDLKSRTGLAMYAISMGLVCIK